MRPPSELTPDSQGKVRDIYDLGEELLLVATDRISAFDVVLPDPIPYKGEVLTKLSLFWFRLLGGLVGNHLVGTDLSGLPPELTRHSAWLHGRSMLVRKAQVFPVECIVRGYLAGSGWKEYKASGTVSGLPLPGGLQESSQLPEPIFTPSTKATEGHDENITFAEMCGMVGNEKAAELAEKSVAVYSAAAEHARSRGIIIADTKFEFGIIDGEATLVDEVLTPDSSRFWPVDEYAPGGSQHSFDKQFVRDWLESTGWDKESEPPAMPEDIRLMTSEKYIEAYEMITGRAFMPEGSL